MTTLRTLRQLSAAIILLAVPLFALSQDAGSTVHTDNYWVSEASHSTMGERAVPFLFLLGVIISGLLFASQRSRRQQELLMQYLERGREIPAALLPQHQYGRRMSLRRGVIFTSVAVGLGLACWLGTGDLQVAAWALIPLSLGIGCFINAALPAPGSDASS